uniref:Endoplasmic reticulum membrane protein complex subunit 7 n=1 Tax=Ciona savignyi TaxID=51511 RepID=H2ZH01_CIOSA
MLKLVFSIVLVILYSTICKSSKVHGRIYLPNHKEMAETTIIMDGGLYKCFMKSDGSFSFHNVETGSYVIEVLSPSYMFEPVRVDISSKGKVRARKLNNLKPSSVTLVKYPLDLKPLGLMKYFQQREKFSILDMLKNPMVLMMVLPMLMLVVLPKLMNTSDPEFQKEMEESMKKFNPSPNQMPDMAGMLANLFGDKKAKTSRTKAVKKK